MKYNGKQKKLVQEGVLPEDIDNKVLRALADSHGVDAVIAFVKVYDEQYPDRAHDKRRTFYVPTLKTITQKSHERLFE